MFDKEITFKNSFLLLAILLALTARSLSSSRTHLVPINDEPFFIEIARDFVSRGDTLNVVKNYFSGEIREDIRNPLFPMILSQWANNTPQDFSRGKLVSLSIALLLVIVVFILTTCAWGSQVGIITAGMVGLSPVTSALSQEILADLLFALFYFGSFVLLIQNQSLKKWFGFGLLAGLAYLSKGNAHLLFLSAIAVGLTVHKKNFFIKPDFYVSLFSFFLGGSFLLVRNFRLWGSPLYNRNVKIFWLDSRELYLLIFQSPIWDQIGPKWYFENHTLKEALVHFWAGFQPTLSMLAFSFSQGPAFQPLFLICTGFVMLGLAILGGRIRWLTGHKVEVIALTVTNFSMFLLFSWYLQGQEAHWRYTFPIAICFFPWSIFGLQSLVKKNIFVPLKWIIGIASVVIVIFNAGAFKANPINYWAVPTFWSDTSKWICTHPNPTSYLIDNRSRYTMWDQCRDTRVQVPFWIPTQQLINFSNQNNLTAAILDNKWVKNDSFQDKYGPWDSQSPITFLGWPRCFTDKESPSYFSIYAKQCPEISF